MIGAPGQDRVLQGGTRGAAQPRRIASRLRTPLREATRRGDSESNNKLFIEKFIDILRDMHYTGNCDRLPVLNDVIPDFDALCKEQTVDTWLHKFDESAQIYGWSDVIIHYSLLKLTSEWQLKLKESFPTRDN